MIMQTGACRGYAILKGMRGKVPKAAAALRNESRMRYPRITNQAYPKYNFIAPSLPLQGDQAVDAHAARALAPSIQFSVEDILTTQKIGMG